MSSKPLGSRNIVELQNLPNGRLLMQLAWPLILSLLVQGAYSIVDSIYLSRLGEEALSAISLAFVAQSLVVSITSGIANGMNTVVSESLGAGDYPRAKKAVFNVLVIQLFLIAVLVVLGITYVPRYFATSTSNSAVIELGVSYLAPCFILGFSTVGQVTCERILQSTGLSRYSMYSQVSGSVVNIILDPILIFGLGPVPALGVAGAAYATITGQFVAMVIAVYFNIKKNRLIFSKPFNDFAFDWKILGRICYIGIPTAAMGIAASLGNYYINRILIAFSSTSNSAFGVYTKLQSVALMPTQGIASALVTVLAFFCGKQDLKRIKSVLKTGMIALGTWNGFCGFSFIVFPRLLLSLFNPTEQMIRVGLPCFRIIGTTYFLSGLMMGLGSFLQATGKSIYSFVMSLSRQVFVRIPAAFFLSRLGNINMIWWSWPISEIVSDIVNVFFFVIVFRQLKRKFAINAGEIAG